MANPKKVVAAFVPKVETVEGITLNPPRLGHWLALEAINHPLAAGVVPTKLSEVARAAVLLSRSSTEARALAADARALDKAMDDLLAEFPCGKFAELGQAVARVFQSGFSTALAAESKGESESV